MKRYRKKAARARPDGRARKRPRRRTRRSIDSQTPRISLAYVPNPPIQAMAYRRRLPASRPQPDRKIWLTSLLAAIVGAGLLVTIAGCDSGSEEPRPQFSAELTTGSEMTGSETNAIDGTAGLSDGESIAQSLNTALDLVSTFVPDTVSVPDSLLDPSSTNLDESTFVFLTNESSDGQGRTITLAFPGDGSVPGEGEYSLDDGGATDSPPFIAFYTNYEGNDLLAAPMTGGTVTVMESGPDRLRGDFSLSMAGAVELQGISEADLISGTPPDSVRTRDAYEEASLSGSFVALRSAENQPLLPFIGSGGLPLSTSR